METEENLTTTHYANNTIFFNSATTIFNVYTCIILSIESPFLCLAIYTVFFLTKSGQGAPVFAINLLISDLIQTFSIILVYFGKKYAGIYFAMIPFAVSFLASLYFMTCIAVERYLLIAHPIWYRHRHPVKCLVCTSLTGWLLSCILFLFLGGYLLLIIPLSYYLVIVFCFVGACRALSQSQSITSLKKRLVIPTLLFVLLSYTFTILPFAIISFLQYYFDSMILYHTTIQIALAFYMLNPIMDCLLYVFMSTDAGDAFRTPHCCSRRRENQSETQLTNLTGEHSHHV